MASLGAVSGFGLVVEATPRVGCRFFVASCKIALFVSNFVLDNFHYSNSIVIRKYYGLKSAAVPAAFLLFTASNEDWAHLESITYELPQ